MLFISCSKFPPGKSVLPIEPAKRVSPTKARLFSAEYRQIPPGVWPGVCRISNVKGGNSAGPSFWMIISTGSVLKIWPVARERFLTGSMSVFVSSV